MRLVFFHLLLLFSANLLATNWQKVYINPMGDSYVDVNNLQKRNNVVYYSRLFDYTQPSPIGVNSSVSQFTVDCIGEKITWLSSKYYKGRMGKGEVFKEGNFNIDFGKMYGNNVSPGQIASSPGAGGTGGRYMTAGNRIFDTQTGKFIS